MNRRIYILLLVVLLYSCKQKHVEVYNLNEYILSDNHKALLSDDSLPEVRFPIELSEKELIKNIIYQFDSCDFGAFINANLNVTSYCYYNLNYTCSIFENNCGLNTVVSCFFPPSVVIFVNKNGLLFIDGETYTKKSVDSLPFVIKNKTIEKFNENSRFPFYRFQWDTLSDVNLRKEILIRIGIGYLIAINTLLNNQPISELSKSQIQRLKDNNRWGFLLSNQVVPIPKPISIY